MLFVIYQKKRKRVGNQNSKHGIFQRKKEIVYKVSNRITIKENVYQADQYNLNKNPQQVVFKFECLLMQKFTKWKLCEQEYQRWNKPIARKPKELDNWRIGIPTADIPGFKYIDKEDAENQDDNDKQVPVFFAVEQTKTVIQNF